MHMLKLIPKLRPKNRASDEPINRLNSSFLILYLVYVFLFERRDGNGRGGPFCARGEGLCEFEKRVLRDVDVFDPDGAIGCFARVGEDATNGFACGGLLGVS